MVADKKKYDWFVSTLVGAVSVFGVAGFYYLGMVSSWTADENVKTPVSIFPYDGEGVPVFVKWSALIPSSAEDVKSNQHQNQRMVIAVDKTIQLGRAKIVYRGMEGRGTFVLDVNIPALDPEYYYPHQFQIDEARKGFHLAGQKLKLVQIRKNFIELKMDGH